MDVMDYGVRRGDIRNQAYAHKAKCYSWSKLCKVFPRGISPTDIDGTTEMNSHFLYIEFKTDDKPMPRGQRLYFQRLMGVLKSRGVVFVCEHPVLENVDVSKDVKTLEIWYWDTILKGLVQVNPVACTDKLLAFWSDQWALHAEEKPNDFIRGLRETAGIYPQSDTSRSYKKRGCKLWLPPFSLGGVPSKSY